MSESDEGLLNIKEAAAVLKVSEVSLRRWTRSGALVCLRVGPKRERRFRREDLMAFLEAGSSPPPAKGRTTARARIDADGVHVDHGKHVCSIYESDHGRVKLAVPFLLEGLRAGDQCYLVAGRDTQEAVLARLDAVDAAGRGLLVVLDGAKSGAAMYDYFTDAFTAATRSSSRRLRVVGDMAWAVQQGLSMRELIDFELRYNQFLAHQFPVASLCQYDARAFSGITILDALKCHEDTFSYPLRRFLN